MGKKSDQALRERKALSSGRVGHGVVNLLGILLAFGVAFGGMLVVRNRLAEEKDNLMEGSGMLAIPTQIYVTEIQSSAETRERVALTEDELVLVVKNLDRNAESYPHEPLPGQLTMAQALECGREWLEDFLLPYLHVEEELSREYKTSCSLWALEEDDGHEPGNDLLSYWTVTLTNQDVSASLTLNAATGQVLDASVCCYYPIEFWERGSLIPLLEDYTDSFGLEEKYSSFIVDKDYEIYESDEWGMYKFLADGELFAVMQTKNFAISSVKEDIIMAQNGFSVHLYLGTRIYP